MEIKSLERFSQRLNPMDEIKHARNRPSLRRPK
jgi:hypothetical protein